MSKAGVAQQLDDIPPPRDAQGTAAGVAALARAQHFVGLVREEGPCGLGRYLDVLDRAQLYGLAVALAAMVPDDTPVSDLLAWLEPGAASAMVAA